MWDHLPWNFTIPQLPWPAYLSSIPFLLPFWWPCFRHPSHTWLTRTTTRTQISTNWRPESSWVWTHHPPLWTHQHWCSHRIGKHTSLGLIQNLHADGLFWFQCIWHPEHQPKPSYLHVRQEPPQKTPGMLRFMRNSINSSNTTLVPSSTHCLVPT